MHPKSPLTNTSNVELVRSFSPEETTRRWQASMGIDVGNSFSSLPEIQHWRCLETGLEFYTPPEVAGDSNLYEQLQKLDFYYMDDKWEFRKALSFINPGEKGLEVGVGFGAFLKQATEKGIDIAGVELNTNAAERVRQKGYRVFEADLDTLANLQGDSIYDFICSFQVLEHVPQPRPFLEGMIRLLKPGGRLILSVPNAEIMRRLDPSYQDLLDHPPHHVGHWDESVFRSLERYFPLQVSEICFEPLQVYHVDWFVIGLPRVMGQRWLPWYGKEISRILFNRLTLSPVTFLCRLGLRHWLPGHTLLVVLEQKNH